MLVLSAGAQRFAPRQLWFCVPDPLRQKFSILCSLGMRTGLCWTAVSCTNQEKNLLNRHRAWSRLRGHFHFYKARCKCHQFKCLEISWVTLKRALPTPRFKIEASSQNMRISGALLCFLSCIKPGSVVRSPVWKLPLLYVRFALLLFAFMCAVQWSGSSAQSDLSCINCTEFKSLI